MPLAFGHFLCASPCACSSACSGTSCTATTSTSTSTATSTSTSWVCVVPRLFVSPVPPTVDAQRHNTNSPSPSVRPLSASSRDSCSAIAKSLQADLWHVRAVVATRFIQCSVGHCYVRVLLGLQASVGTVGCTCILFTSPPTASHLTLWSTRDNAQVSSNSARHHTAQCAH